MEEDTAEVEEDAAEVKDDAAEVKDDAAEVEEDAAKMEEDVAEVEKDAAEVEKESWQLYKFSWKESIIKQYSFVTWDNQSQAKFPHRQIKYKYNDLIKALLTTGLLYNQASIFYLLYELKF